MRTSTALPAASDNEREGGIGEEKAGDRPRCSRGRSRRVTNAHHARKNSLGCGIKLGSNIRVNIRPRKPSSHEPRSQPDMSPGSIRSSAAQPMVPMRNTLGSIRPRRALLVPRTYFTCSPSCSRTCSACPCVAPPWTDLSLEEPRNLAYKEGSVAPQTKSRKNSMLRLLLKHAHCFPESLRPPRCVSTGPVVVRLAGMANERERERFPEGARTRRTERNCRRRGAVYDCDF